MGLSCCLCCPVIKSCLTLCNPMDCNVPGFLSFTISWSLPKLMSFESVMLSNHLILCHPLLPPSVFPSIRVFSMTWLFTYSGQTIGASVPTSVLPMNIQDWFPLGLTGLISLLSKDSKESSPAPQFKIINSSVLSLLFGPTRYKYLKTLNLRISWSSWACRRRPFSLSRYKGPLEEHSEDSNNASALKDYALSLMPLSLYSISSPNNQAVNKD